MRYRWASHWRQHAQHYYQPITYHGFNTRRVAPAAATSSLPAGIIIAQGSVTIRGNSAVGIKVAVYAWPPAAVLSRAQGGAKVPWRLVGSATTAIDGSYQVRISDAAALRSLADRNGYVNLEIDAGTASWSFSRRIIVVDGMTVLATANADMGVTRIMSPEVVNLQTSAPGTPCYTVPTLIRNLGKNWAIVGQSYSTLRRVTQSFSYTRGQESSLGVGVSYSGKAGSFYADGTWSQSSSATQAFPSYHKSNDWYRTEFKIGKFLRWCPALHIAKNVSVRVIGWAGGDNVRHPRQPPRVPQKNCVPEIKNSKWYSNNTAAVAWSKGLTIPAVSFDASAQTGYDRSAQVEFVFHQSGSLCGTHDVPGGDPRQIVARR